MRVGFFTDTFLPQRNGVVASLLSFGSELVRRGHEVHVFCPKTHVKKTSGVSVHSYPAVKLRSYPEFKIAIPRGRDKAPRLDIVHTHSPFTMGFFGWRVAKFQGIPRVSTFHTLLSEYSRHVSRLGKPILKLITWRLCRIFYNRHKKLIVPSKILKEVLREHGIKKPVEVIPTGVDTNFYRPIDRGRARRKLGLGDNRIFLCLGRVSYEKNLDLVIRAIKDVEADLLIVGRGPTTKRLKTLVKKEKLYKKVFFKGFVPEEIKPFYYSAADALVNASTSETQGMVIVESMACGCPVIGAKSLAIPELVKDGENGYLFEAGSTEELTEILKTFQPSKQLRACAVETAQRFSVEKCTEKLEKFYTSVVK
jgi:glycosyltransferase involved in cell wall biosynthesis